MTAENKIETLFRLPGKKPDIISLMLLSAFASMGAIVMMPALPKMADFFGKDIGTTQLAVTTFLLGYAVGQLFYGPLANRYGRKFALYVGIFIATLGSLFSIFSSPFDLFSLLIAGRFLEAFGATAGLAISITIINEFYFEKEARQITGWLMFAFAIVPGVAIATGGYLVQYFHWISCFYFLLFYGLLLLYPAYKLPETLQQKDFDAVKTHSVLQHYKDKFINKKLMAFAMLCGLSGGCVYVFGAEGPFIGIHLLKLSPSIYGLWGLTPYIGTFIGSIIVVRLEKYNSIAIIKFAFLIELTASIIMLILFLVHDVNLYSMLIPMGIFCVGNPILAATAITLAMQQDADKSNTSAVANFTSISMPVLLTFLLGAIHIASPWIMPVIFLFAMLLMCGIYWRAVK